MSHLNHLVVDDDAYFDINPTDRSIEYVGDESLIISQADHNSERYTFYMPRYVEGHDMSQCDLVEIHYINISSENRAQKKIDIYTVTDLTIDPEDNDSVMFTWLVSQNATSLIGSLSFACRFMCMSGSNIDYVWSTTTFSAITIAESINNSDDIAVQYADILQEWYMELLSGSSMGVSAALAKIEEAKNKAIEEIEAVETIHELEEATIANIRAEETSAKKSIEDTASAALVRVNAATDRIETAEATALANINDAVENIINNIPRYAGETRDVT